MQETVAAAMVHLSGWDGRVPLTDPMCGSGTLIIEAAMAYCRIPAATLRTNFGFQHLPDYDPAAWQQVRKEAQRRIRQLPDRLLNAFDIDPQAVAATRANCRVVPGIREINVLRKDIFTIDRLENQVILCNPPYGIRLQGNSRLEDFYRQLGDFLKQRCNGSQAFIYFGNREMIKSEGLKPSWKKPLRNGGLDGRVVKYEMY
jgi:putative N6-adenine-specific DNA methylase